MKLFPFFILLFIAFVSHSQTPCQNNFAGEYPCSDIQLMSRVPVSTLANNLGNPEGSDIWGWTDPTTQKEYAIAAMTNSTAFVDVTDPINPIFLGRLDTQNGRTSFWRDVKVYNNHAFIVADNVGDHGMQVFDLTKLRGVNTPQSFAADAVFTGVNSCHNIVINESSAYAYLVGCNTYSGGIHFVDISDPKNPVDAGGYSAEGYTHDAQVITYNGPDIQYTGKELFVGSNANDVVILDVTNKNNVVKIADIIYPQIGYTHQGWFTDDHSYFILGDETDEQNFGMNTRSIVFDFKDLDNPSVSSTYFGPTRAIDHNGYVKGNLFYIANYRAGLRILDISNIENATNSMSEVAFFDTYPANNNANFNGAWSVYPYFNSENIIINDIERGLFVVRQSGTFSVDNPSIKNSLSLFPNPIRNGESLSIHSKETITKIEVFSILGSRVLFFDKMTSNQEQVPINNLTKGVYFVKVNGSVSEKFIVE